MSKKSKHPRYDDPTAFGLRWPTIREETERRTAFSLLNPSERQYKMGKVLATVVAPDKNLPGYFMTVRCKDRYPTWDEIVWLRYNLIPDAAIMSLVLPNLNAYINQEDTGHKYVFTLEQNGWAIDPPPQCPACNVQMKHINIEGLTALFRCPKCQSESSVDLLTWNEQHGNGFRAAKGIQP